MASVYGTGADGDVVISSDTQLAADKNYRNLTINAGKILTTAGYTIRVSGILINNGQIKGGNTGTPGTGGTGGTGYSGGNYPGGNGTNGTAGSGGAGSGGGGGGGGGSAYYNIGTPYDSGGTNGRSGGAGGYGSKDVIIYARVLLNNGTILADGQDGNDSSNSNPTSTDYHSWTPPDSDIGGGSGGGGGGGGGGDAGDIDLYYMVRITGTTSADGGAGGNKGLAGAGCNCIYGSPGTGDNSGGTAGTGGSGTGGDGGAAGNGGTGILGTGASKGSDGSNGSAGANGNITWTQLIEPSLSVFAPF